MCARCGPVYQCYEDVVCFSDSGIFVLFCFVDVCLVLVLV